jgi:hypothetical protein
MTISSEVAMFSAPKLQVMPVGPRTTDLVTLRIEPRIYHYSAWQNLTLAVWVGQATGPSVRNLGEISREMIRRHPEGHSSVVFILDKIPAPTPEAREVLDKVFHARNDLACVSVVIEGSGFWASGMRSLMGNTHRAAAGATSTMLRLNTEIDEVVEWMPVEHLRRTGVELDPIEFRRVLRQVREQGADAALNA